MIFFVLMIKGFIVGIAFIIPGVSGGTLAVYLGIYKKLLDSIANIFRDVKNSLTFLIPFGLGVVLSVFALAKLFGILIEWNSFVVLLFFIGLLAGGIAHLFKKTDIKKHNVSNIIVSIAAFLILLTIIVIDKSKTAVGIEYFDLNFTTYILLIALGMISATTMIVPGISGSAVLMVLGFYTAIVSNVIGNVFDLGSLSYNIQVIMMFLMGVVIGILLFSKLISYLLEKYPKGTYSAILGLVLASTIGVFLEIKDPSTANSFEMQTPIFKDLFGYLGSHPWSVVFGIILFACGFLVSLYLTKFERKGEKIENT
ncbi:MAG: DUF368 domain-containing protein [Tenericutes bacterium]|jgi:putative membrane protein|nr:DUF368 domain-containing protein [Mycoplasmatota bacterium]